MAKRGGKSASGTRRVYPREFKEEAVQMLLDGHSASSVGDPPGAVTPLVPPEHLAHQRHKSTVFPFALRLGFVPPGVKA